MTRSCVTRKRDAIEVLIAEMVSNKLNNYKNAMYAWNAIDQKVNVYDMCASRLRLSKRVIVAVTLVRRR